jgi:hypothetical protein
MMLIIPQTNLNIFTIALLPCVESKETDAHMKHLSQAIHVSTRKRFKIVEKLSLNEWVGSLSYFTQPHS